MTSAGGRRRSAARPSAGRPWRISCGGTRTPPTPTKSCAYKSTSVLALAVAAFMSRRMSCRLLDAIPNPSYSCCPTEIIALLQPNPLATCLMPFVAPHFTTLLHLTPAIAYRLPSFAPQKPRRDSRRAAQHHRQVRFFGPPGKARFCPAVSHPGPPTPPSCGTTPPTACSSAGKSSRTWWSAAASSARSRSSSTNKRRKPTAAAPWYSSVRGARPRTLGRHGLTTHFEVKIY